jgi:hypothetical protein
MGRVFWDWAKANVPDDELARFWFAYERMCGRCIPAGRVLSAMLGLADTARIGRVK